LHPRAPNGETEVGAVAREDHAPVDEAGHPAALESINAIPFLRIFHVGAKHRSDLRVHIFWPDRGVAVDLPAKLEVDPPDVVRLLVQSAPTGRG